MIASSPPPYAWSPPSSCYNPPKHQDLFPLVFTLSNPRHNFLPFYLVPPSEGPLSRISLARYPVCSRRLAVVPFSLLSWIFPSPFLRVWSLPTDTNHSVSRDLFIRDLVFLKSFRQSSASSFPWPLALLFPFRRVLSHFWCDASFLRGLFSSPVPLRCKLYLS